MVNQEKILEEGKKIIEEFSEKLKGIPETEETHYVVDLKNVTRPDAPGESHVGFRAKFEDLAPKWDDGYVRCEKKR